MDAPGPLAGILVVDLTRVLAGPFCTLVLADLGARVVKVESPDGDDARRIGPFVAGRSAYFASLNRGKQSIALDLRAEADRSVFEALVARADVLVENFRPGVMKRLGYGWEALHVRHPRLVAASVSGFGQTGPYAARPAYDVVVQGMGGIMSLTGHPGAPPTRVGTSSGDITAGLFAAIGIQAALVERARSGEGRFVDVAMLDCQVATLENAIARYQATGQVPGPLGSRHPSIAPFQALATRDVREAVPGHRAAGAGGGPALREQRRSHAQRRGACSGARADAGGEHQRRLARRIR
jgi:CoA:oxalate CoA-transferase